MRAICFVDDQEDERDRVKRFLAKHFTIGTGSTLEDALRDLREKGRSKPDLFLMDMYFPDGPTDVKFPFQELNKARSQLLKAETKFYQELARLRQTAEGGFKEARKARDRFSAPIVFFTRKGTIDNAIRAYEVEHATSVLKKPDPPPADMKTASPEDLGRLYDEAFAASAASIAGSLQNAIHKSKWYVRYGSLIGSFLTGVASSALIAWFVR